MSGRRMFSVVCLWMLALSTALAADISGKWKATFDTAIGVQNYTYEFQVTDGKLSGKAESQHGKAILTGVTVTGDIVKFTENLDFQGMEILIEYTGKISGDQISFTRKVADVATEELVAKRVKD